MEQNTQKRMAIGIIEVTKICATLERPHGIRYNLTFHDNHNQRILGYDNAHSIKIKARSKYSTRIIAYDHMHSSFKDKGSF